MNESTPAAPAAQRDPVVVLERLHEALAAIDSDKLHPGNFDAAAGASLVLGHMDALMSLRPAFQATFRAFNFAHLDNLRDYATVVKYLANAEDTERPRVDLAAVRALEEGRAFRTKLAAIASMFANLGVFDATDVRNIERKTRGYEGTSDAILSYCVLFVAHRSEVEGNMPLSMDTIESGRAKAVELAAIGSSPGSAEAEKAADLRRRAVTLFMNAYQEVKWAVEYVRRVERDANQFAPALSNRRASSRGGDEEQQGEDLPEDKKAEQEKASGSVTPAPAPVAPAGDASKNTPPLPDSPFKR